MKYSRVQIEVMARAAGWGSRAKEASYVAREESGGDAGIVNEIGAVGLLQILQPTHVKDHPGWTVAWLKNPINNLKAGKILFDQAGQKWDGPWLDSRDKGATGGWAQYIGKGSSGGATQVDDDPCELLKGTPGYEFCVQDNSGGGGGADITDLPAQIGRLAQLAAKAGNWAADPANWLRVAYVVGGGVLAIAAVNVVARPYLRPVYGAVRDVIPTRTIRDVRNQMR